MKTILLIIISAFMGIGFTGRAQCTINTTPTQPGIYPDTLPAGMVGQPYSEDITFVMPTDTSGFDFTNFYIQSIAGLPFGLTWECNAQANNCNYNPQSNQYGCMNVSGTPIQAGIYPLTVAVIATLQVLGDVPATFQTQVTIVPDTSSNVGFAIAGGFGCLPLTTSFVNMNPGLLAYGWDFGNGTSSTQENPSPQIYTTPGNYAVTYAAYTDTIPDYYLTNVDVLGIPNNWGFPGELNPDIYVMIYDGNSNLVHTSGTILDTDPPVFFPIPNILLNDQTYTVEVWDEDGGLLGADDYLGSTTFQGYGPSGSSTTGSISIAYTIQTVGPFPVITSTDTVQVFGYPSVPNIDSSSLLLWTDSVALDLQWYQNGNPVPGADSASFLATTSGDYFVISNSPAGCYASSDTITIVICDTVFTPAISQTGALLFTDTTSYDIQWFYNGTPISGATGQVYTATNEGDYWVQLTSFDGCSYNSPAQTVDFSDLTEYALSQSTLLVYPNPSGGIFTVQLSEMTGNDYRLSIRDLAGRVVLDQALIAEQTTIDLSQQQRGIYFVTLHSDGQSITKKIILN